MANLLILPWLRLKKDYRISEITLVQWNRDAETHQGLDAQGSTLVRTLMGMYRDLQGKPIQKATLACLGGKKLLDNLNDEELQDAFDLVELLAFAGLSNCEHFESLGNYCNRACFDMISQRFDDARHVAFVPRRRVRRAICGWGVNQVAITVPLQCHYLEEIALDESLLLALTALRRSCPAEQWATWQAGIACFNWGNTDSETVRWQTEWILLCSAFERLLGEWQEKGLVNRLLSAFQPERSIPWVEAPRSADKSHKPTDETAVRGRWIMEFCNQRGDFAHGKIATHKHATWSPQEHLLLAAIAFPLLVKQTLQREGYYQLTDDDRARINVFEAFAGSKSFQLPEVDVEHHGDSVWRRLLSSEYDRLRSLRFEERCRAEFPHLFDEP